MIEDALCNWGNRGRDGIHHAVAGHNARVAGPLLQVSIPVREEGKERK
jgi:hypothetical protein